MKNITITIDEIDPNDPHYIIKRIYQGEMISENKTLTINEQKLSKAEMCHPIGYLNNENINKQKINKEEGNGFNNWLYNFMPTMKYILPETIPVGHEINATKHALSGSHHYRCYYILYVNKDLLNTLEYRFFDCKENVEKALFIQELHIMGWDGKTKLDGTNVIRENKS